MLTLPLWQKIILFAIPLLFAITVHEVSHGWVANLRGDPTAKDLGRLTLNPIPHIDLVGTIIVPGILLILGGIVFGWAKPVPVDSSRLHNPRSDMAIVALAGPLSNFLMAIGWAIFTKLVQLFGTQGTPLTFFLQAMGVAGMFINIVLMVLNLIPVPPLDGSRVLASLVSPRIADLMQRMEIYGFLILVLLLASGLLVKIIKPPIMFLFYFIARFFGL